MDKTRYPLYFAIVGLILIITTSFGEQPGPDGHTAIPLLALLAMCEIGFFCAVAGAFFSFKRDSQLSLGRVLFGLAPFLILGGLFALKGLSLWPH